MYDNIKMRLPLTQGMPDFTERLENVSMKVNADGVAIHTVGNLQNLKVFVSHGYLYINGSLSAYLNGNNIYPLNRHSVKQAVEKISDDLGVDVSGAKVTSLEIGATFPMAKPIECYFAVLGDLQGFRRTLQYKGTLYYSQQIQRPYKQIYFYDKLAEMKRRHKDVPPGFESSNLLKCEIRLTGGLCRQLNVSEVKASTLGDAGFYHKCVKFWESEYNKIQKVYNLNFSKTCTAGECFEAMAGYLMNEAGDKMGWLLSSAMSSANLSRMQLSRLKAKIRQAKGLGRLGQKNELLKELNDCVMNAGCYV